MLLSPLKYMYIAFMYTVSLLHVLSFRINKYSPAMIAVPRITHLESSLVEANYCTEMGSHSYGLFLSFV